MALWPGSRLDQYEILAVLGTGGMGEVYKARDLRLDRLVAVKVITSARGLDPASRERFEREARSLAALSHPNICQIFQYGDAEGAPFLVMEYLEGETVTQRLRTHGRLPPDGVLRYGIELAAALEVAHRAGIVHRDLKPDNIILTATGLKLLDLGVAKRLVNASDGLSSDTTRATLTGLGIISGTLTYMAPEQLEGQRVDTRSDIFSFGAVLYEMATGRRAFAGSSQAAIIASIMTGVPPRASILESSIPVQLDAVLDKCLEKRPTDRFRDVSELRAALEAINVTPAITDENVGDDAPRVARKRKRRRLVISFSISISFLFLAAVFIPRLSRERAPDPANQSALAVPAPAVGAAPPAPNPSSVQAPASAKRPGQAPDQANNEPRQVASAAGEQSAREKLRALTETPRPAVEPVAQGTPTVPATSPAPGSVPGAGSPPAPSGPTGVVTGPSSGVLASGPPMLSITSLEQAKREIAQLVANYCTAMETLQAERVKELYPRVDLAAHREQFRSYLSLKCTVVSPPEYDRLDAGPAGSAQAKVGMRHESEMRIGGAPKVTETVATFRVSRQSIQSPWLIDWVQSTPKPK